MLSPPLSLWSCQEGKERRPRLVRRQGHRVGSAGLQDLSCSPEQGPQRFSTHLRPLNLIFAYAVSVSPSRLGRVSRWPGLSPGGPDHCFPGYSCSWQCPELCLWRRPGPLTMNFRHTLCQYLVRDRKAIGGLQNISEQAGVADRDIWGQLGDHYTLQAR